ncbi:DUF4097 family beta strand repeat-containing protein [Pelagicoccus sp. SDUM812003]|uniref:DUF4097 family beta strand repeat-containing protein n=1 Tax=Pelagicoccus sp. SDUM812003 TaxID=3041267 RepID=UPI00280FFC1F|nr:DUF4097 family beta strand repeat-containing protein [Pelagicoccus sp. SDUM812003]MDQ8203412.1 DUF4097 family beta strand repeat-containing protein [Pelagicoccus sp. SDUM812003]
MKNSARIWLALLAIGIVTKSGYAQQLEIPIESRETEVEVTQGVELLVAVYSIDIDVEVFGESRSSVRLEFDGFEQDETGFLGPRVYLHEESGNMSIKLGPMVEGKRIRVTMPFGMSTRVNGQDSSVRIESVQGEIDVSTVDGDIDLLDVSGGIVAHTVDGEIRIELNDTELKSPVSLATVDGDIEVLAREGLSANVNVSTIDGTFRTEIPITSRQRGERFVWGGVNLKGTYGAGGAELFLKTIDGDIEVKLRK